MTRALAAPGKNTNVATAELPEPSPTSPSASPLAVVAGLLRDDQGRALFCSRPSDSRYAGLWEFPGGKVEADEGYAEALARELNEELGIQIGASEPLMDVECAENGSRIRVHLREVVQWRGTPSAFDGQRLRWQVPAAMARESLTPADRYLLASSTLPHTYVISGVCASQIEFLERIAGHVQRGTKLVQLRLGYDQPAQCDDLARRCKTLARDSGVALLLNGSLKDARDVGLSCHLPARELLRLDAEGVQQWRECSDTTHLLGASCHNLAELRHAQAVGCDFAVLSPVRVTRSHPRRPALGLAAFTGMVADVHLPVFGLGGLHPRDEDAIRRIGGHGVAGISAFW